MDIYKEKFTKLEREVLRLLFANSGKKLNQREIALSLKVSPTAVANSIKNLGKTGLLDINKNEASETFEIGLNLHNNQTISMKRVENLRLIYDSGLAEFLSDHFPGTTIVLFGSYSFGEDSYNSDIDIAIIGIKEKSAKLTKLSSFEKVFGKKIIVQYYEDFNKINKNLKESILNGIILKGSVKL